MTICINNSDTKNNYDKLRRNGYTALCQDHKHKYGTASFESKLEINESIFLVIKEE